jgi:signal transduction histidine kinase
MFEKEGLTIILALVIVVILGVFVVLFFLLFLKRKNALIKSKEDAEVNYKQEIIKTQIEIREETLRNISWELHDNIGQLMTLAKIQAQNAKDDPLKIEEAANSIAKGLDELRALSKNINPDTIKDLSLEAALKQELDRFNKLNFLETQLEIKGTTQEINANIAIVLFRILQEFFSNTIKHSQASNLKVGLKYSETQLEIQAKDNGIGFDSLLPTQGQGLKNMIHRAALIGAKATIQTKDNSGTSITILYPLNTNIS